MTSRFRCAPMVLFVLAPSLAAFGPSASAQGDIVQLNWSTQLQVIPGMEGELPAGVHEGDLIQGFTAYNTDAGSFSYTPTVANYPALWWQLDLGAGLVYSRFLDDGLGNIGQGSFQVRNNNPAPEDWLTFGASSSTIVPPNEYIYFLRLIDTDGSVWDSTALPHHLPLEEFEVRRLWVYHIRLNDAGHYEGVPFVETTDFQLDVVPEPAVGIWCLLLAMPLTRRKRLADPVSTRTTTA